jgi:hypothetical protein
MDENSCLFKRMKLYKATHQEIDHEYDCDILFAITDDKLYCFNLIAYHRRFYGKVDYALNAWSVMLDDYDSVDSIIESCKNRGDGKRTEITDMNPIYSRMRRLAILFFNDDDIIDGSIDIGIVSNDPNSLTVEEIKELLC